MSFENEDLRRRKTWRKTWTLLAPLQESKSYIQHKPGLGKRGEGGVGVSGEIEISVDKVPYRQVSKSKVDL